MSQQVTILDFSLPGYENTARLLISQGWKKRTNTIAIRARIKVEYLRHLINNRANELGKEVPPANIDVITHYVNKAENDGYLNKYILYEKDTNTNTDMNINNGGVPIGEEFATNENVAAMARQQQEQPGYVNSELAGLFETLTVSKKKGGKRNKLHTRFRKRSRHNKSRKHKY